MITLPHFVSTIQVFAIPNVKFMHNGSCYVVENKIINGVETPDDMSITFILKKED